MTPLASIGTGTWVRYRFAALVCLLLTVLLPPLVCATHAGSAAETRVAGFELGNPVSVGLERPLTRTAHQGYAVAYDHLASGSLLAARGGTKLLNPPIKITPGGLTHTIERHAVGGPAKFAGKSKFNAGENIQDLIHSGTQQPMVLQPNGNFARTFDAGRQIGTSMHTGQPTSMMTIITNADGALVTAFPGVP